MPSLEHRACRGAMAQRESREMAAIGRIDSARGCAPRSWFVSDSDKDRVTVHTCRFRYIGEQDGAGRENCPRAEASSAPENRRAPVLTGDSAETGEAAICVTEASRPGQGKKDRVSGANVHPIRATPQKTGVHECIEHTLTARIAQLVEPAGLLAGQPKPWHMGVSPKDRIQR